MPTSRIHDLLLLESLVQIPFPQVQELTSLARRAKHMGASDLLPAEAAAKASLQQELHWLLQDTTQLNTELAAAAANLIVQLSAAVQGAAGPTAGVLDGVVLGRRASKCSSHIEGPPVVLTAGTAAVVAAGAAAAGSAGQPSCDGILDAAGTAAAAAAVCGTLPILQHGEQGSADIIACSIAAAEVVPHDSVNVPAAGEVAAVAASAETCGAETAAAAGEEAGAAAVLATAQDTAETLQEPEAAGASSSTTAQAASEASKESVTAAAGASSSTIEHAAAEASGGSAAVCADSQWELDELLLQYPLAAADLQQQLQQAYASLLQQTQQQLQAVSAQQQLHTAQCGSWSGDEHALFVWLRGQALQGLTGMPITAAAVGAGGGSRASTQVFRAQGSSSTSAGGIGSVNSRGAAGRGGKGCSKTSVLEYVSLRMPGKSKQQLDVHEAW
jgi:hypothetical protein